MNNSKIMAKLSIRDLRKNWLQYLSMIMIIFLAVTLFCGFISNSATLSKTIKDYYDQANLTDLTINLKNITEEDKVFFNNLDCQLFEYRFYSEGTAGTRNAKIYVGDNSISRPLVSEGKNGVLVDKNIAKNENYEIGANIDIVITGLGSMTVPITGFMNFAEVANTYASMPVFLSSAVFQANFPLIPISYIYNQVIFKTDDTDKISSELKTYFSAKPDNNMLFIFERNAMEAVVMLEGEISQSQKMIYVFPVVFLLVSILVILATIRPLILRERTNIGTLKGLGISDKKIMRHYANFGTILCFIGGILGVIVGPLIVPNVMIIKYNLVYTLPPIKGIVYSFPYSALAVFGICALAALISYFVCHKVIKSAPALCMRPEVPKDNLLLNLTASKTQHQKNRNLPWKMAIRNIIIKPSRAFMTVIGIVGCAALLVCGFGIGDTIDNGVDIELGGQFKYDIATTYAETGEEQFLLYIEALKANEEIDDYETYKTFYMTAQAQKTKDIRVFAYPDHARLTTIILDGKNKISKNVAKDLGVSVHQTVHLSIGNNSYDIIIDEIIETSVTQGIFVSTNVFDENYHIRNIWIKATPSIELIDYINTINGTKTAHSMEQTREEVTTAISSIGTIKLTMMIFSIALSVVVLYNLSLLSVKERVREIATMKVLGFNNRQIGLSLLYEIMILVIIGTIFGLMLGYPFMYLVMSINRIEVIAFIYAIKPISYVLSAVITIVTSLIINLIFGKMTKHIPMIESLKRVE